MITSRGKRRPPRKAQHAAKTTRPQAHGETPTAKAERIDKARRKAAYAANKRAQLLGDEGDAPAGRDMDAYRNPTDRNLLRSGWNVSNALNSDESIEYLDKEGYSFTTPSTLNPHVSAKKSSTPGRKRAHKVRPVTVSYTTPRAPITPKIYG